MYQYQRLEDAKTQIRLLELHSGESTDEIDCDLLQVPLEAAPNYQAVSYTWGSNSEVNYIYIRKTRFAVPGNAYAALHDLRSISHPALLWIDAICINQHDIEEKRHQILLMKLIYEKASEVVVWLSEPRDNPELAANLLAELHSQLSDSRISLTDIFEVHKERARSPSWIALRNLFAHPWFMRTWILQEIVLARAILVHYGKTVIPWEHISTCAIFRSELYDLYIRQSGEDIHEGNIGVPPAHQVMADITWLRTLINSNHGLDLETALMYSWLRKATDPRDKIYGLLGIAQDASELGVSPSYTLPVSEVYEKWCRAIILKKQSFALIRMAGVGHTRLLMELPTYIPDWTCLPPLRSFADIGYAPYSPTGNIPPRVIYKENANTLVIAGCILDRIKEITPTLHVTGVREEDMHKLHLWLSSAENMSWRLSNDPYCPLNLTEPVPLFEAFWRSLIGNRLDDDIGIPETSMSHGYLSYKYRISHLLYGAKPFSVFEKYSYASDCESYRRPDAFMESRNQYGVRLASTAVDRRFCVTEKGLIGLVPPGTAEDDLISIFVGAETPFVVRFEDPTRRSLEDDEAKFQLVGECYVHGIMEGEAVEAMRRQRLKMRHILLT